MDLETYESFLEFGEEFEDDYGGKLQRLLAREEFICFHELIRAMVNQIAFYFENVRIYC